MGSLGAQGDGRAESCDSRLHRGRAPSAAAARPAPAPSTTPAIPRHGHPGVLTFPGEGAPEQGQDLHVPPSPPAVSQQTGPAPLIYSPGAGCHGAWKVLGFPLANPVAQEEPGPGAESCSEVAATAHRRTAKREGQPGTPRGACSRHRDALQLLCSFPPARHELDQD